MVKLFVGNLPENMDPHKLRQIFAQHIRVTECDVIKNYAFVHVDDEDDELVDAVITRLNGYVFDGRTITLERSTSKLRKQPGMSDKCFRCGATEHKTPMCPLEPNKPTIAPIGAVVLNNGGVEMIRVDLTGKRSASELAAGAPDAKRMYEPTPGPVDAEIAKPNDPELQQLYSQYMDSRNRYTYYRDCLIKEMQIRKQSVNYTLNMGVQHTASAVSAQPVPYVQQQPQVVQPHMWQQQPQGVVGGSAPYQQNTALKAPYAIVQGAPTSATPQGVPQQQPTVVQPGQYVQANVNGQQVTYMVAAAPQQQQQQQQPGMVAMQQAQMVYQQQQPHVTAAPPQQAPYAVQPGQQGVQMVPAPQPYGYVQQQQQQPAPYQQVPPANGNVTAPAQVSQGPIAYAQAGSTPSSLAPTQQSVPIMSQAPPQAPYSQSPAQNSPWMQASVRR